MTNAETIMGQAETPNELERERQQLAETWAEPRGLIGWFKCVHHLNIGRRFVITAFVFFLLGGLEAVLMRVQLARPENHFLGPDLYNQIFTMHGTTMMFLFAVPMMEALGIYLVPLMVGARNIAFPRLNAFGYYIYLFGGIFLYLMFLTSTGRTTAGSAMYHWQGRNTAQVNARTFGRSSSRSQSFRPWLWRFR